MFFVNCHDIIVENLTAETLNDKFSLNFVKIKIEI